MEPIPEAIVEKTWQEVAGFSHAKAKKEMMKIGNSQPELLAFVTESSKEMGQEVRELGIRAIMRRHGLKTEELTLSCYPSNLSVPIGRDH